MIHEKETTPIVFLPEGRHFIRWIFDPEGKLYREMGNDHILTYGYLYQTRTPSEYWEVDRLYVIIGTKNLKRAILGMLEILQDEHMPILLAMLTPTVTGFASSVQVLSNREVSIQIVTKKIEPIDLTKFTYLSLENIMGYEFLAGDDLGLRLR